MKKLLFVSLFLLLPYFGFSQTFIALEDENEYTREYHDDIEWVYRYHNDFVVGVACIYSNVYGKYYQVEIFLKNLTDASYDFNPADVTAIITTNESKSDSLEVYTNAEFQKKVKNKQNWTLALESLAASGAGYSNTYSTTVAPNGMMYTTTTSTYNAVAAQQANENYARLSESLAEDRMIINDGYLKRNTLHPGEAIQGIMNIKKKNKGMILQIHIPVNGFDYVFCYNVSKRDKKM